jgi:hypothetical protein
VQLDDLVQQRRTSRLTSIFQHKIYSGSSGGRQTTAVVTPPALSSPRVQLQPLPLLLHTGTPRSGVEPLLRRNTPHSPTGVAATQEQKQLIRPLTHHHSHAQNVTTTGVKRSTGSGLAHTTRERKYFKGWTFANRPEIKLE